MWSEYQGLSDTHLVQMGCPMVFLMARPTRLANSRFPYARKVVPSEVRAILGRPEFKRPLHGATQAENKRLHAEALAEWEGAISVARLKLAGLHQTMSARQIDALCGEWYRDHLALHEDSPGDVVAWEEEFSRLTESLAGDPDDPGSVDDYEATPADLAAADKLWTAKGIAVDAETVRKTAQRLWVARIQFTETMTRRARGDWGQDDHVLRFPSAITTADATRPPVPKDATTAIAPPPTGTTAVTGKGADKATLTFTALVVQWASEVQPPQKSHDKWKATFAGFAGIVGHDEAHRVTLDQVRDWKQTRASQGRSQKTIADGIAVMRGTFNWGIRNGLLPKDNPFSGMAPKLKKHGLAPRDGYTDEEARTVLTAARAETGWRRWLPWVLCFSGARIEEIAELRCQDIRKESGVSNSHFGI